MLFWCFLFAFFVLINLETQQKKDTFGKIETQQWQLVTSVNTTLQIWSKKIVGYDPQETTYFNNEFSLLQSSHQTLISLFFFKKVEENHPYSPGYVKSGSL